jgi:hypothetical protein
VWRRRHIRDGVHVMITAIQVEARRISLAYALRNLACALILSIPLAACGDGPKVQLWDKVISGMTVNEIAQIYEHEITKTGKKYISLKARPFGEFLLEPYVEFENDRVIRVRLSIPDDMRNDRDLIQKGERLLDALIRLHGGADSVEEKTNAFGIQSVWYRWKKKDLEVQYVRWPSSKHGYGLSYAIPGAPS